MNGLNESVIARFWSHVDKRGPDECWEWTAYHDKDGYGNFSTNGRPYGAHRIALIIASAFDDESKLACHTCNNRGCVNPAHIYWGTPLSNMQDKIRAHRDRHLSGEENPVAKLTWDDVGEIRETYAAGRFSMLQIADRYGVTSSAVRKIIANLAWRDGSYQAPVGRCKHRVGRNVNRRLTWEAVDQIREIRKTTRRTLDDIARAFGVSSSCIQKVVYMYTWRDSNVSTD